jgi:hypothetical protein
VVLEHSSQHSLERTRFGWTLRPRQVGSFFLWTSGIHVGIVAADPGFYRRFADDALVPGLSSVWRTVFMAHPATGGLLLAAGEALLGLLLLARTVGRRRLGWAGVIAFHIALMCFGWGFWIWCVPALLLLANGAQRDGRQRRTTVTAGDDRG